MTALEKRNIILKQVITPLLKHAGFKKSGLNWWLELKDCYLIIRMRNSRFNGVATGFNFEFQFSATLKDELKGKITEQWIYNQGTSIEEYYFLPHFGILNPFKDGLMGYTIDGYKNYEPQDLPVEGFLKQIQLDFQTYIIPKLLEVHTFDDWNELKTTLMNRREEKEIRLLLYFSNAHHLSCSPSNQAHLTELQKLFCLSNADIRENMDLLKAIAEQSRLPKLDSWNYVCDSISDD